LSDQQNNLEKKMKIYRFALFIMILGLFSVPTFAQDTENNTDFFGYYFIEKAPKGFSDISEIHLAGDYGESQTPPFYGLIRMKKKAAKDFQLNKPTINGKNISFTTKAVAGVSYQFSGTFTKLDNFPTNPPDGVVLKGTLTKMKGKTKLAASKVNFTYSPGD